MAKNETKTKNAVKKMLSGLSPAVYQCMPASGYGGKKGIPDHVACVPVEITPDMVGQTFGLFVGIEAKKPGGKMHGLQPLTLAQILAAGGFAQVVDSQEAVDEVEEIIRERYEI